MRNKYWECDGRFLDCFSLFFLSVSSPYFQEAGERVRGYCVYSVYTPNPNACTVEHYGHANKASFEFEFDRERVKREVTEREREKRERMRESNRKKVRDGERNMSMSWKMKVLAACSCSCLFYILS